MEENVVLEQEVEQVEQIENEETKAKHVNPVLAWGVIAVEFLLVAVIAMIVILPLA